MQTSTHNPDFAALSAHCGVKFSPLAPGQQALYNRVAPQPIPLDAVAGWRNQAFLIAAPEGPGFSVNEFYVSGDFVSFTRQYDVVPGIPRVAPESLTEVFRFIAANRLEPIAPDSPEFQGLDGNGFLSVCDHNGQLVWVVIDVQLGRTVFESAIGGQVVWSAVVNEELNF